MLKVRMFGKFSIERDGHPLHGLEGQRVQELFAYLLLHHGRAHLREALATALWSESGAEQARKYLRQTLWQLQSALESATVRVVLAEPDWVRINPDAALDFDVATFEQITGALLGVRGAELEAEPARLLRTAELLYTGDLLDGWYQDWCLFERERLQNQFMQTLDKLMVYCEKQRDYETGLFLGSRLLSCDRAHERTHRRLMRLHYLAGDRTAALRQYQRCATILADELNVKPSHRTTQLYEQIRSDHLQEAIPRAGPVDVFSSVVERIAEVQASLADLMRHVQEELVAGEQPVSGRL